MVTVLDTGAGALVLTGTELTAAALAVADPGNPSLRHPELLAAMRALEAAGLAAAGQPVPVLATVAAVVHRPQLRLVVEVFRTEPAVAATVWATPDTAVLARPREPGSLAYSVVDPVSVPFVLAAVVGLGCPPADAGGPFTVNAGALDRATVLLSVGRGVAAARGALVAGGASRDTAGPLLTLVAQRRQSWRAGSAWMDAGGAVHEQHLAVLDAGSAGMWRCRSSTSEPTPDTVLTLDAIAPAAVWVALVDLLPRAAGENG